MMLPAFPLNKLDFMDRLFVIINLGVQPDWDALEFLGKNERNKIYNMAIPNLSETEALTLLKEFRVASIPMKGNSRISLDLGRSLIKWHPNLSGDIIKIEPGLFFEADIKKLCESDLMYMAEHNPHVYYHQPLYLEKMVIDGKLSSETAGKVISSAIESMPEIKSKIEYIYFLTKLEMSVGEEKQSVIGFNMDRLSDLIRKNNEGTHEIKQEFDSSFEPS